VQFSRRNLYTTGFTLCAFKSKFLNYFQLAAANRLLFKNKDAIIATEKGIGKRNMLGLASVNPIKRNDGGII